MPQFGQQGPPDLSAYVAPSLLLLRTHQWQEVVYPEIRLGVTGLKATTAGGSPNRRRRDNSAPQSGEAAAVGATAADCRVYTRLHRNPKTI